MKNLILILTMMLVTGSLAAQQTRVEITNASSVSDSRLNSNSVPDGYVLNGQFNRILIFRFKYQADLLGGLDSLTKVNNIKNAVILSGIGSVRNYHLHSVSNRTFPTKNIFIKDTIAPADIASMNGYIINGRVHAHVVLTNADKAFGGHLEKGTNVFTFAIVTIGVLSDSIDLGKVDDKNYR
ncbi:MAG TPA: PPC domain-containing DNA-binding protein [Bacteroidales bacterium]